MIPVKSMSPLKPLALVTGASAGIGAEFARQLAARGYDLALTARRRDRLVELAGELEKSAGAASLIIEADLAETDACTAIVAAIDGAEREVDLLVNNAGYGVAGYFNARPWAVHADFLRVMVSAPAELIYRVLPSMQEKNAGEIINVASLAGLVPGSSGHTLYAAAKGFLVRFSESLAMENHGSGIRVQALCPGFTYSEFHDVVGTRDIVSQMPDYMWMKAADVVRYSLDQLEKPGAPVVAVPGRANRLIAALSRKLPYKASYHMVRRRAGQFRKSE